MAAITSAVIGAGVAVAGAVKQRSAEKKANRANAMAAQQQRAAHKQTVLASEASIRAEALREKQMELEGNRRRLQIMQQTQAQAALSASITLAQGAQDSSSARAAQQAAASRERMDILANLQNIMIGRGIFEENRAITRANTKAAEYTSGANIQLSQAQSAMNQASSAQSMIGFGLGLAKSGGQIQSTLQTGFGLFGGGNGIL